MAGKEQIVEELGDRLLPNLVNKALAANDRAKFLMTLLQTARVHADDPQAAVMRLQQERLDCGIDDPDLDAVVEGSRRTADGMYLIPWVDRLLHDLFDNVEQMVSPLEAFPQSENGDPALVQSRRTRLEKLVARIPCGRDGCLSGADIDDITTARAEGNDSVHLLVMHLHRDLNRLQQIIAAETIDEALVYGLTDPDRLRVAAFMRGVNRTRCLKFDHPGLDTTATRSDGRLVIQNDIGTTDSHVLVVHVTGHEVTVTYTDVHMQRLVFFQSLMDRFAVTWEDTRSRRSQKLEEELYHLCTGRFFAADDAELDAFLNFFGSRIVFLIDWNRARKRLRRLVPKRVCLEVLRWAADQDIGHMAFLRAGGEQLVFDALQQASPISVSFGGQLTDVMGGDRAAEFLRFIFRTAADLLLTGHSEMLIRDEVRAELRHYLDSAHQGLLEMAAEHATLIVELATGARECLLSEFEESDGEFVRRTSRRASRWEHRADEIVSRARTMRGFGVESSAVAELLRVADDAADELEEAIFLLTVSGSRTGQAVVSAGEAQGTLQDLADLVVAAAQEYLKVVENARRIHRRSSRDEMADFLQAVDNTISLEHDIDDQLRHSKAGIFAEAADFRQLYLSTEVAALLESASDATMRAALTLRDYVMDEVISR